MAPDPPGPLGDMTPDEFRRHGHDLVDWIASYLGQDDRYPVLSRSRPGEIRAQLPAGPPESGATVRRDLRGLRTHSPARHHPLEPPWFLRLLRDFRQRAGVLAELLTGALNVQAMLWRTSPAATELEEVALGWLRQLLACPQRSKG